jgi:hypothetical protein
VTSTAMATPRSDGRRKHQEIPIWDQELRNAKNEGKLVKFQLAVEGFFTDEDGMIIGEVLKTDKDGVKIKEKIEKREIWIRKSFVLGTEILSND